MLFDILNYMKGNIYYVMNINLEFCGYKWLYRDDYLI